MFVNCSNCKKDIEPTLDASTLINNQVVNTTQAVCSFCKQQLSLSIFMKKTLASMQKFYKPPTAKSAFSFKCTPCDKVLPAKLSKDQEAAICSECGKTLNLSKTMIRAMILAKNNNSDL